MKSGVYKTNFSGESEYKSFCPTDLNEIIFDNFDNQTIALLTKANYLLGKLNELSDQIIDIDQFIGSYVRKEALYSSQIEGTQATLEDVLDIKNENSVNADIEETINNVKAINYAISLLDELPLCNRSLKMTHKVLMNGVRGNDKNPGEFRKSQNWIGHSGSTLKNAKYIPPNLEDLDKCLSDLEKYINNDSNIDSLIKAALIHYQFETIHPFLDGNGRIGRILIIIFLISEKKLKYPCLYISYYLKRNQYEYYQRMSDVRLRDDYIQWIDFFLQGIIEICEESIDCIKSLVELRNCNKQKIKVSDYWLLSYLEKNPIIDSKKTSIELNIDYYKVNRTVNKFVENGILIVNNTAKKNRTYSYNDYINILKK